MNKKILSLFTVALMAMVCLSGCKSEKTNVVSNNDEVSAVSEVVSQTEKVKIVTTIFPEYDAVMEIIKGNEEKFEVTMLLDSGTDLHSFQPSVADIAKISTCDIFAFVGGESDEWAEDAVKESTNPDLKVVNLMSSLSEVIKEEELVEGMEGEEEEEEGEEEEEVEYDEHVWLSLRNQEKVVDALLKEIVSLDSENASLYESNAKEYNEKLNALDEEFKSAVDALSVKTLIFGDRFPFRYFVDDYNLSYFAAFIGCSAETEASFETISFLAKKADELKVPAIFTIEGSDGKIAETIVENSENKDIKIVTFDSMQSVTAKDVEQGETYISVMTKNLETLKSLCD